MIRDFCSSLIASFVVVLGTACTDVEPSADEPAADLQPSTGDPGLAIDPTQLVDYVHTPGGELFHKSCTREIEDGATVDKHLVVTRPDAPCEYPSYRLDETGMARRIDAVSATASAPAQALSYTQVGVGSCAFAVYSPSSGGRNGFAQLGCADYENLQLQVCLQQLVTGGWQTIDWTCTATHSLSVYVDEYSGKVPYYTNGRWYRTWAWAYANGASRAIVSGGFQG